MAFRKMVLQIEVLFDDTITDDSSFGDLDTIKYEITEGHSSGGPIKAVSDEKVSPQEMAKLLEDQGSDPSFLLGESWEKSFNEGDIVSVPEPEDGDSWQHSFSGRVIGHKVDTDGTSLTIVADQEDDHFDVETNRLGIDLDGE